MYNFYYFFFFLIPYKKVYDVTMFGGKKSIVLSTSASYGGKNKFLEGSYYAIGVICYVASIFFLIKKKITNG